MFYFSWVTGPTAWEARLRHRWLQLYFRSATNSPCFVLGPWPWQAIIFTGMPQRPRQIHQAARVVAKSIQNPGSGGGRAWLSDGALTCQTLLASGPGLKTVLDLIFSVNPHHKLKTIFLTLLENRKGYTPCPPSRSDKKRNMSCFQAISSRVEEAW